MQQGLFQFVEGGEFLVEGGEALGFFCNCIKFTNQFLLLLEVRRKGN